jgi:hypothetical protein
MFPALARALVLTGTGPLILPACYQTPAHLRSIGAGRLTRRLRAGGVRGA